MLDPPRTDFFFLSIMYLTLPTSIYPAKASNVYYFCEMLIGIEQDAKKRIAVNKFILALWDGSKLFLALSKDANFATVVITTLYQVMQKSWYQKTAQSLTNMLL